MPFMHVQQVCIYNHIYIYIWVNYNDLTATSLVDKGNHPKMAQNFRLVNYCNVPRYMVYPLVMTNVATKNGP